MPPFDRRRTGLGILARDPADRHDRAIDARSESRCGPPHLVKTRTHGRHGWWFERFVAVTDLQNEPTLVAYRRERRAQDGSV
jgi:hypothetical protein